MAARSQTATRLGQGVVELHADLRKAFEAVSQPTLIKRAHDLGYPLFWLRLVLSSYRWPRRFQYNGRSSHVALEDLGAAILVVFGSATLELKLYLVHPIEHALQKAHERSIPGFFCGARR